MAKERKKMSEENKVQAGVGTAPTEKELKDKYGKVYRVCVTLTPDDDTELEKQYYFCQPSVASYDRYIKTASNNATRSLKNFLFDSVLPESNEMLKADLEEYPALSISVGEKLLAMMGLSKDTNLKKL